MSRLDRTLEPTKLSAIGDIERGNFVHRVRDAVDRCKINISLTPEGRAPTPKLLPAAIDAAARATAELTEREIPTLLGLLAQIQRCSRE